MLKMPNFMSKFNFIAINSYKIYTWGSFHINNLLLFFPAAPPCSPIILRNKSQISVQYRTPSNFRILYNPIIIIISIVSKEGGRQLGVKGGGHWEDGEIFCGNSPVLPWHVRVERVAGFCDRAT